MEFGQIDDKAYENLRDQLNENESLYAFIESKGITPMKQMSCIFHSDRSPSLSVNDSKGKWHCFSCGAGGGYFEMMYNYYRTMEDGKLSKKEYLEEQLSRNKQWQVKYNIKSLRQKVEFSANVVKAFLNAGDSIRTNRSNLAKSVKSIDIDWKNVNSTKNLEMDRQQKAFKIIDSMDKKDTKGIMQFLASIQHDRF